MLFLLFSTEVLYQKPAPHLYKVEDNYSCIGILYKFGTQQNIPKISIRSILQLYEKWIIKMNRCGALHKVCEP